MIIVDSSVWIDFFNGHDTAQVAILDGLLGRTPIAIGDLILVEVLQGLRNDSDFELARQRLESLVMFNLINEELAVAAAQNYRFMRSRGITIRKSIDTIIATFCIEHGHALLHSDRGFDPFAAHLGLKPA